MPAIHMSVMLQICSFVLYDRERDDGDAQGAQIRLKQEHKAAEKENEAKPRVKLLAKYENERLQRQSAHKQRIKLLDIGLEDKAMMIASAVL